MRTLFLSVVLLLAGSANAQTSSPYDFHRQLDRCMQRDQLLCIAHVLVDAIFAVKDDTGRDPDQGRLFTVELFENYTGKECSSYTIVKFSLVHGDSEENLRRCEKLNQQYGMSRAAYCQKIDGASQIIRGAYVGSACKDLAYQ